MKIEKLDISHMELLGPRLRALESPISEFSFPNLYLFREVHAYEVIIAEEIFIRGRSYGAETFLMPTSDLRHVDMGLLKELLADVDYLFPVPEEWAGAFETGEFETSFNEGEMDYIYRVQKMSTYGGRKLHRKRNLTKLFTEAYEPRALPLTNERLPDAMEVLRNWQEGAAAAANDYGPCMEALTMYERLGLCGGIYYAKEVPVGFVIGEELNDETFVLHFAKALTRFKGVYQYIFQNFAQVLPPKYIFLNFEPDLDIEALRHAKESYRPDQKLKKLRVRPRRG